MPLSNGAKTDRLYNAEMSIPAWIYKLGSLSGFGFLYQLLKPVFSTFINRRLEAHDQSVWDVLKHPKMKAEGTQGDVPFYGSTEVPYSIEELAAKVKRSTRSVRGSCRRLERRGRVKELVGGWQRKEK